MKILPFTVPPRSEDLMKNVFVYPTDTCYGIGCNALDEDAVARIYTIKKREMGKPVSIMVDSVEMFSRFGLLNPTVEKLIEKYLPGQLTIVVPKTRNIPPFLNPQSATIGIRIPDHAFCLKMIRAIQSPIVTTSANIAGNENLYDPGLILDEFATEEVVPDILYDGGELAQVPPSTVVEVVGDEVRVLRQGSIVVDM